MSFAHLLQVDVSSFQQDHHVLHHRRPVALQFPVGAVEHLARGPDQPRVRQLARGIGDGGITIGIELSSKLSVSVGPDGCSKGALMPNTPRNHAMVAALVNSRSSNIRLSAVMGTD